MTAGRRLARGAALAASLIVLSVAIHAQGREWTTSGSDAQRSRSVRRDERLTRTAVEEGDFRFLWKATFDNEARGLESLTEPILEDRLIGHRGFKALAFVGGTSDRLFAIDTDLARPFWTTYLTYGVTTGGVPVPTPECPGGLLAAPSRRTPVAPAAFGGRGSARGARATSAVGEPGQGAVALKVLAAARTRTPPSDPPPPSSDAARTIAQIPFGGVDPLYAMGSDGLLRTLRVSDGLLTEPPTPFVPPDSRPSALVYIDGYVYATTSHRCGAAPNAVWSIDTVAADRPVSRWDAGDADVLGTSGPTVGTDGTLYVALVPDPVRAREGVGPVPANAVVALDRKTLSPKDWFSPSDGLLNAPPTVFRHEDRDLLAVTDGEGRLYVLDSRSLGGPDHKQPLATVAPEQPGRLDGGHGRRSAGLATWEDGAIRWILAPTGDAITAFRLRDQDGLSVERVWTADGLTTPLAPIVVNGIVFVAASGEYLDPAGTMTDAQRVQRSAPAVLHALDLQTGRKLWSSGTTITSFARAGLAAASGQVYLVTHDNTLYAFGIPMER